MFKVEQTPCSSVFIIQFEHVIVCWEGCIFQRACCNKRFCHYILNANYSRRSLFNLFNNIQLKHQTNVHCRNSDVKNAFMRILNFFTHN